MGADRKFQSNIIALTRLMTCLLLGNKTGIFIAFIKYIP
jgi:hypothetical protein